MEQALAKLEKYPLEERVHFEKLCREELADIYLYADDPRAAGQIGRCIDLHLCRPRHEGILRYNDISRLHGFEQP